MKNHTTTSDKYFERKILNAKIEALIIVTVSTAAVFLFFLIF